MYLLATYFSLPVSLYQSQSISYIGSLSVGPLLNIILFLIIGDTWEMNTLKNISLFALAFGFFIPIPMFFLKDKIMS